MAETMKAWRINELGKPPVLEEVPIPEPGFGEILIKMKGAGMCRTDLEVIDEGFITVPFEGPFTFGHENAGTVAKLGPGVDTVEVGQNVIVDTLHACGKCQYCLSGRDNFCEVASARGLKEDGGMAEYMIADA
ncbi:MAG: alcohol dehydrogenase catalytic domain-containing protein, partial [Methanobrevibacter sp.]|nr:alcohol dehydrogenase catalytic domain-containing protein [Methanobrevibacter sp.]